MNELNNKLDGLSELVTRIDAKILDINTKLEELITALHAYDDDQLHCEYSGLPSVKAYDNEKDILSWDVDGAERRMDIIGQNGNEGLHYDSHHVTNEEADEDAATFNDYGMRVGKDKSNNSAKHVGEPKKRNSNPSRIDGFNKRKYYKPKQQ
jgi:hypothetical protein